MLLFNVRSGSSAVLMHCLLQCDEAAASSEKTKQMAKALQFMVGFLVRLERRRRSRSRSCTWRHSCSTTTRKRVL